MIKSNNINEYVFIGDNIEFVLEIPYNIEMVTIFLNRKSIKQNKFKEVFSIEELKVIL